MHPETVQPYELPMRHPKWRYLNTHINNKDHRSSAGLARDDCPLVIGSGWVGLIECSGVGVQGVESFGSFES